MRWVLQAHRTAGILAKRTMGPCLRGDEKAHSVLPPPLLRREPGGQRPHPWVTTALVESKVGFHNATVLAKRRRRPCHSCGKHLQPALSPFPHPGLGVQRLHLQVTAALVDLKVGFYNATVLEERRTRPCHSYGRHLQLVLFPPLPHLGLGV